MIEIQIVRISANLSNVFALHLAQRTDDQLWNNANETDMAAKLTNSNWERNRCSVMWLMG